MLPHALYQPPCHITWQGISIEIRYCPLWFRDGDYAIAHLEIRRLSGGPLPFTETGRIKTILPFMK